MLLLVLVLLAAQTAPQAPPRDHKPAASTRTAAIAGRVVDAETGTAVEGSVLNLYPVRGGSARRVVESASNGAFALSGLEPGPYHLRVSPPRLQAAYLPQLFNVDSNAAGVGVSPPSLTLQPGEKRSDVLIRLERAAVVEGRVVDEYGEPMANVRIVAERPDGTPARGLGRESYTDDRGNFRAFGLAPGAHRICALPARDNVGGMPVDGPLARKRYGKTCFPAATDGELVMLRARGEPPVVTIAMQRTGAFTISGHVSSESGDPNVSVMIYGRDPFYSVSVPTRVQNGQFVATGVPPGEYTVSASSALVQTGLDVLSSTESAGAVIRVVDTDVTGLRLVTTKGATVRGRLIGDGPPPPLGTLQVAAVASAANTTPRWQALPQPAAIRPDLTFEVTGVRGALLWDVRGLPPQWVVTAVRYRGVDVTDTATVFESNGDPAELEITVSPRSARLIVRPVDAKQGLVTGARVLLLQAKGERQPSSLLTEQKHLPDGSVEHPPVHAGEYLVAAIPAADLFQLLRDPQRFAALKRVAQRLVLVAGAPHRVDVLVTPMAELPR